MFVGDESISAASQRKTSLPSHSSSTTSLIEKDDIIIEANNSKVTGDDETSLNDHGGMTRSSNSNNNHHHNVISGMDHRNTTQDLTRYFNMSNFKRISVFVIFIFIFYHGYLNSFYGK
jgi:hypothetical protein